MLIISLLFQVLVKGDPFVTPFGTELGNFEGVVGYSNGNDEYVSSYSNYEGWVRSGLKWQCVEYSRRYLIVQKGLSFESIPCASDIWHLNSLSNVYFYPFTWSVPLHRVPNGSLCKPKVGDIIIYQRISPEMSVGHVCIIAKVTDHNVYVAEQNWTNDYWPSDYSRVLTLEKLNGKYYIKDDYPILGWMVYEGYTSEECFDPLCKTCSPPNNSTSGCTYL